MPRDDLGNPVSLTRTCGSLFFRPLGRGDRAIVLRAIDKRFESAAPSRFALAFVGSWVPAWVMMILTALTGLPFTWCMGLFVVAFAASIPIVVLGLTLRHRRGRTLIDACLATGCCPACLYPIAPQSADPNQVSRCAECGAAWRVPRAHPRHNEPIPAAGSTNSGH